MSRRRIHDAPPAVSARYRFRAGNCAPDRIGPAARHSRDLGTLRRRYPPETLPALELATWPSAEPQGLPARAARRNAVAAAAGDAERSPGLARLEVLLAVAGVRRAVHGGPERRTAAQRRRLCIPRLDHRHDRRALRHPVRRAGPGPGRAAGPVSSVSQDLPVRLRAEHRVLGAVVQAGDGSARRIPGYPFLAAPFQWLGIIRLAPLFYGALGCLGLFFGARRWLGRFGGTAAVGLFCSSGAALLSAWQDYWPTFTDASLIAAGTGALLWAVLADGAAARRPPGSGCWDSWPSRPRCSSGIPTSSCWAAPSWLCSPCGGGVPRACRQERFGGGSAPSRSSPRAWRCSTT